MGEDLQKIRDQVDALIADCKNVVIASIMDDQPLASQAPFAVDDNGNFLVLVSGLAAHGRSLRNATRANIMLMVDEANLPNPFARERLNYDCKVEILERETVDWHDAEQRMRQRFGKFVDTLLQLPDFSFFRFLPYEGRYVAGFGAAYRIHGGEIEQVRG